MLTFQKVCIAFISTRNQSTLLFPPLVQQYEKTGEKAGQISLLFLHFLQAKPGAEWFPNEFQPHGTFKSAPSARASIRFSLISNKVGMPWPSHPIRDFPKQICPEFLQYFNIYIYSQYRYYSWCMTIQDVYTYVYVYLNIRIYIYMFYNSILMRLKDCCSETPMNTSRIISIILKSSKVYVKKRVRVIPSCTCRLNCQYDP